MEPEYCELLVGRNFFFSLTVLGVYFFFIQQSTLLSAYHESEAVPGADQSLVNETDVSLPSVI